MIRKFIDTKTEKAMSTETPVDLNEGELRTIVSGSSTTGPASLAAPHQDANVKSTDDVIVDGRLVTAQDWRA